MTIILLHYKPHFRAGFKSKLIIPGNHKKKKTQITTELETNTCNIFTSYIYMISHIYSFMKIASGCLSFTSNTVFFFF